MKIYCIFVVKLDMFCELRIGFSLYRSLIANNSKYCNMSNASGSRKYIVKDYLHIYHTDSNFSILKTIGSLNTDTIVSFTLYSLF